jgi:hypothetical protein
LFAEIILHSRRKSLDNLYVYLNNARPHNARRSIEYLHAKRASRYRTWLTVRTSHEVTSSSLALKRKLAEYDIRDRHNLRGAITHIFDEIEQETHITVFETWINRLEWVVEHEGDCIHQ